MSTLTPSSGLVSGDATSGNGIDVDGGVVSIQTGSGNLIYVASLADLPDPVGSIIEFKDSITLVLTGNVDLGANKLLFNGSNDFQFFNVQGYNDVAAAITSSHVDATIECTSRFLGLNSIFVENSAPTPIPILINHSTCTFFFLNGSAADFTNFNVATIRVQAFADMFIRDTLMRGTISIETDSPDSFVRLNNSRNTLPGSSPAGTAMIKVAAGVTLASFDMIDFRLDFSNVSTACSGIEVANPDDIGLGTIENCDFINPTTGGSTALKCNPVISSSFDSEYQNNEGAAFDGTNLIVADGFSTIGRYTGIGGQPVTEIVAPTGNTKGVVWLKGDLYSYSDSDFNIYQHDGFSTTIISQIDVTSIAGGTLNGRSLTTDGTNIILITEQTGSNPAIIYVLDGFSTTILETIVCDAVIDSGIGVAFDGVNLIVTQETGEIHVMDGVSGTIKYTIEQNPSFFDIDDCVVTNIGTTQGLLALNAATDEVNVFDSPVTFDHSSNNWDVMNNTGGLVESSDRGGVIVSGQGTFTIALSGKALGEWAHADAVNMFYSDFTRREKCHMDDDILGEIIWTGPVDRARTLQGIITANSSGNGGTFEIAIGINDGVSDVVQTDSIGEEMYTSPSDTKTLRTMPISRDLVSGDKISIRCRRTVSSFDLETTTVKLSIY